MKFRIANLVSAGKRFYSSTLVEHVVEDVSRKTGASLEYRHVHMCDVTCYSHHWKILFQYFAINISENC